MAGTEAILRDLGVAAPGTVHHNLKDAKLYEIGAGTSEIRRMLIGRELYQATA